MIVADTGAVLALIDADDHYHAELLTVYEEDPGAWILPWAILPEVDYLLQRHVGDHAERAFLRDIGSGSYAVEWGHEGDLQRASEICDQYRSLHLGLVDAVVIAVAERLGAASIATLDLRHFASVDMRGSPRLLPRDR
ncbi:MAG TPA: PIN domain-containing protein [Gemmatimonadaceae bacterium]